MRTRSEVIQGIKDMERLLEETERKYERAIKGNDLENIRILFFDRSLMKARLTVLGWIMEKRGLPI